MIAVIWVNLRRAMGDRRLLIIGTLVPVVIILITGLLEGSPKEPIGLYHPSARLVHLAQTTDGVKVRVESTKQDLTDDILRGRVVAGIEQLPAPGNSVRADFLVESSTTDAVQAARAQVALMDLMAAEGPNTRVHRRPPCRRPRPRRRSARSGTWRRPASSSSWASRCWCCSPAWSRRARLGVLQRLSATRCLSAPSCSGQMAGMMITAVSHGDRVDLRRLRAVPGALGQPPQRAPRRRAARDQRGRSGRAHRHLVALAGRRPSRPP